MLRPSPREFQLKAISDVYRELQTHQRVLLQMPTGAGKTLTACAMAADFIELDQVVVFVVHRKELLKQTSQTFKAFGIEHSYIAAGMPHDPKARVFVAMIDTMNSWLARGKLADFMPRIGAMFVDEAHRTARAWQRVIFAATNAVVIALTATPERPDDILAETYQALIRGPEPAWLMGENYLARYKAFTPYTPDLKGVGTSDGDYAVADLEKRMNTPALVGDAVATYKRYAMGLRTISFCVSVAHSKAVTQAYNDAGIPAAHLDGEMSDEERDAVVKRYADGELLILTCAILLSDGFDLAANANTTKTVDCVQVLRPTKSRKLWLQMIGRALRWAPDKIAILLDHGGCCQREGLGLPDEYQEWSLESTKKMKMRKASEDVLGPPPPVTCTGPACFMQVPRPLPSHCPHCGSELVLPKELPRMTKGQLAELTLAKRLADKAAKAEAKAAKEAAEAAAKAAAQEERKARNKEARDAKTLDELKAIGAARGHDSAWAPYYWREVLKRPMPKPEFQR